MPNFTARVFEKKIKTPFALRLEDMQETNLSTSNLGKGPQKSHFFLTRTEESQQGGGRRKSRRNGDGGHARPAGVGNLLADMGREQMRKS